MDDTARKKGLKLFAEIYGDDMAQGLLAFMAAKDQFGTEQARWTVDFAFGSVWAREGLERRMRSAAVLGMLIGLRAEDEIKYHTRMALKNGVTRLELEEIFYTAIPYAGFPAANVAKKAMLEVFAEIDAASD